MCCFGITTLLIADYYSFKPFSGDVMVSILKFNIISVTYSAKHPFSLNFKKGQKYEFKIKVQSKISFLTISLFSTVPGVTPAKELACLEGSSIPPAKRWASSIENVFDLLSSG